MKKYLLIISVAFLASGSWGVVQAAVLKDSIPFLQPYPGSSQTRYLHRQYDEIKMPLGPFKKVDQETLEPTRSHIVEGEVTFVEYYTPKDRSSLEVMRNYQQTLEQEGFQVLWHCKNNACNVEHTNGAVVQNNPVWTSVGGFRTYFGDGDGGRMLTACLNSSNGSQTWIYLWVSGQSANGEEGQTAIYAAQTKSMQTGLVQGGTELLSAAAMSQTLGQQGRFAMHLPFDFNKAMLRPNAMDQIRQLAEALRNHPNWRIGLDGHTDAVGSPAFNQELSADRAAAVKSALVSLGVPASQVATRGLGATQPVAGNETAAGRTQNRRVEVVNLTPGFIPVVSGPYALNTHATSTLQAPAMVVSEQADSAETDPGSNSAMLPRPANDLANTATGAAQSELHYQFHRAVSNLVGGLF